MRKENPVQQQQQQEQQQQQQHNESNPKLRVVRFICDSFRVPSITERNSREFFLAKLGGMRRRASISTGGRIVKKNKKKQKRLPLQLGHNGKALQFGNSTLTFLRKTWRSFIHSSSFHDSIIRTNAPPPMNTCKINKIQ